VRSDELGVVPRVRWRAGTTGSRSTEGRALVGLGTLALLANRFRDAVPILRRAVDATRQSGDARYAFMALCHLSAALMETGRGDESFPLMYEAIELCPNVDPLDVLDFGTNGKVRSFLAVRADGAQVPAAHVRLMLVHRSGRIVARPNSVRVAGIPPSPSGPRPSPSPHRRTLRRRLPARARMSARRFWPHCSCSPPAPSC
jgi:hypothetical protein